MAIMRRSRATFSLAPNFRRFLENIKPNQQRRDAAKKYPSIVRDFLERTTLLSTVEPDSLLTGSYRRRIAIHEIKDVDFVVFVDEQYDELGALAALNDLKAALDAFAHELEEELGERPEVELREQRRSVRVRFKTDDFYLDVVPVRAPDGTDAVLQVPDREWKNWQPTACVQYCQVFSNLNQGQCEELLVPLMKTVKHWRSQWFKRNQAKSFWLEAMIVNLIASGRIAFDGASLAEVIAQTFTAIRDFCEPYRARSGATPVIPDPVIPELNGNLAFNWSRSNFETFMNRIDEACERTGEAVGAASAADAIAAWQKLLGDEWFPAAIEDEAAEAESAANGGRIAVGTAGAVYIGSLQPNVAVVRPRPHLNHGDEVD